MIFDKPTKWIKLKGNIIESNLLGIFSIWVNPPFGATRDEISIFEIFLKRFKKMYSPLLVRAVLVCSHPLLRDVNINGSKFSYDFIARNVRILIASEL